MNTGARRSRWPGMALLVLGGLVMLSSPVLIWVFRDKLAEVGPQRFVELGYGLGGLGLIDFTAGLPLGAILLALGAARLSEPERGWARLWLVLMAVFIAYFAWHVTFVFRYGGGSFAAGTAASLLVLALFVVLVWTWARRRPGLALGRRHLADLQLGAGLSFFAAAWQVCGLVGAPGFAVYPDMAARLGEQSFLFGQAVAVLFFSSVGFLLLTLGMRADQSP